MKNAENFVAGRKLLPLIVRSRHVTAQNVSFFIEQDRQMTRDDFSVVARDQRAKAVRMDERIDRWPIFNAIE